MKQFLTELYETFLPSRWQEICQRPVGRALGFFSKILLLAFVVMVLLGIPTLFRMPGEISDQLGKFDTLQLSGNFTMSSPIKIPKSEPAIILDTSGAYNELTSERLLITRSTVFYRPLFATHELPTAELKDLKRNRDTVNTFLAVLVFFLLPSFLFYAYLAVWLKYFVMILALSIALFVLLDLTHWRRTWKELFVIGCHASFLPVLAEVAVGAINPALLIPVLNVLGLVKLYLVPAVVLSVLAIGAALCVHYNSKEQEPG